LGIFFVRYLGDGLRDAWRGETALHLENLGVFQLLAWTSAFVLIARSEQAAQPLNQSRSFTLLAGVISLTALLPDDNAAWLGLSALAACLVFAADRFLRAAGLVMLALAIQLFWGRMLFEALAFQIEVIDARLAAGLLSLLHQPVSLKDNFIATGNHQIVIYEACTSFHNISLAMLAFVAITKFFRTEWRRSDLTTVLVLVVITVAMNSLRLFLMASSAPGMLDFWHVGPGSQIINAVLSGLIAAICLWGAGPRGAA
jgi:exosortase/archaeosortase family protein